MTYNKYHARCVAIYYKQIYEGVRTHCIAGETLFTFVALELEVAPRLRREVMKSKLRTSDSSPSL